MTERLSQIMGFLLTVALAPVAVAGSCCLGVLTGVHYCATAVMALRRRRLKASFHPNAIGWAALWHMVAFPLLAAALGGVREEPLLVFAAGTGAALAHAVVLAPLCLLVPAQLHAQLPVSLERAHVLWDQVSPIEKLLLVVLRALATVIAIGVCLIFPAEWFDTDPEITVFIIACWVYGLGAFAFSDYLTRVYTRVRPANTSDRPSPKRSRWSWTVALVLSLLCIVYMGVAVSNPSPMEPAAIPRLMGELGGEQQGRVQADVLQLEFSADGAVHTRANDGYVPFRGRHETRIPVGSYAYDHRAEPILLAEPVGDEFRVSVRYIDQWRQFRVNGEGLRTDDRWGRRAQYELNGFALLALFAVLFLLGRAWLRELRLQHRVLEILRHSGVDDLLAQGATEIDRDIGPDALPVAITGVLRGRCPPSSGQLRGDLVIEAVVNGTSVRLRIPPEGVKTPCVGKMTPEQSFEDGKTVTLFGEFDTLMPGQREAFLSWPEHAVLVTGTRDRFVQRVSRESRRLSRTWLFFAGTMSLTALVLAAFH